MHRYLTPLLRLLHQDGELMHLWQEIHSNSIASAHALSIALLRKQILQLHGEEEEEKKEEGEDDVHVGEWGTKKEMHQMVTMKLVSERKREKERARNDARKG